LCLVAIHRRSSNVLTLYPASVYKKSALAGEEGGSLDRRASIIITTASLQIASKLRFDTLLSLT
jgi:hypothetical protein